MLLAFGTIALGVVCLHAEEACTARRIQQMHVEMVTIRRELWSVQLAIARHKSPQRISNEVAHQTPEVLAPDVLRSDRSDDAREWVSAR